MDPRDRVATALGEALSGERVSVSLTGAELLRVLDRVATAVERHVPVVFHVRGDARIACHQAADLGAFLLAAADESEASDLALVAQRTAERALVPGIVTLDAAADDGGEEDGTRGFRFPGDAAKVSAFLGHPNDLIDAPTPAQELLFGRHRRLVPHWSDPEQPALLGAGHADGARAAGLAGQGAWFGDHVAAILEESFGLWREASRREPARLATGGDSKGRHLVLTAGATVAAAREAAGLLRTKHKMKVGVIAVNALRPFPSEDVVEAIRGREAVLVVDRAEISTGGEPPLLRELRAVVARAGERARGERRGKHSAHSLREKDTPRLHGAVHEGPGDALRAEDLVKGCLLAFADPAGEDARFERPVLHLGIDFLPETSAYPKRRALADRLRRLYPDAARRSARHDATGTGDVHAPAASASAAEPLPTHAGGAALGETALPGAVRALRSADAPWNDLARFWNEIGAPYREGYAGEITPDPFLTTNALPARSAALTSSAGSAAVFPAFDASLCTGCAACWAVCPDAAVGPAALGARALLAAGMELAAERGRSADALRPLMGALATRIENTAKKADPWTGDTGALLDAAFQAHCARSPLPEDRRAGIEEAFGAVRDALADLPLARTAPFFEGSKLLLAVALNPDTCKGCGLCVTACEPEALRADKPTPDRLEEARAGWARWERLPEVPREEREKLAVREDVDPMGALFLARASLLATLGADLAEPGSGEKLALRAVLGAAEEARRAAVERAVTMLESQREALANRIHETLARTLPDSDLEALARGLRAIEGSEADLASLVDRVDAACRTPHVDAEALTRLVDAARELADLRWRLGHGLEAGGRSVLSMAVEAGGALDEWMARFPCNPFAVPVAVERSGGGAALARGIARASVAGAVKAACALRRARLLLELPGGAEATRAWSALDVLAWKDLTPEERALAVPVLLVGREKDLARVNLDTWHDLLGGGLPVKVLVLASSTNTVDLGLFALAQARCRVVQSSPAFPRHLAAGLAAVFADEAPALVRLHAPTPSGEGVEPEALLERAREAVARRAHPLYHFTPNELGAVGTGLSLDGNPLDEETAAEPADDGEPASATPAPVGWRMLQEMAGIDSPWAGRVRAEAERELAIRFEEREAALQRKHEEELRAMRATLETEMTERVRDRLMVLSGMAAGASGEEGL